MKKWYPKKSSGGQGTVNEEDTGRTVALAYDEKDAALLAAAPALLAALIAIEADMVEAMRRHGGLVGSVRQGTLGNAINAIAHAKGEG